MVVTSPGFVVAKLEIPALFIFSTQRKVTKVITDALLRIPVRKMENPHFKLIFLCVSLCKYVCFVLAMKMLSTSKTPTNGFIISVR